MKTDKHKSKKIEHVSAPIIVDVNEDDTPFVPTWNMPEVVAGLMAQLPKCPDCYGSGKYSVFDESGEFIVDCQTCAGVGVLVSPLNDGSL